MEIQKKNQQKYKNIFFSRIISTGILILLQAAWFITFFMWTIEVFPYASITLSILGDIFVIYLLNRENEKIEYRIAWIILVLMFPIFGVPFYFLSGNKKKNRVLQLKEASAIEKYAKYYVQDQAILQHMEKVDKRVAATAKYIYNDQNYPVYGNTDVTYFNSGEDLFFNMLKALEQAERYIFLEYFTIEIASVWIPIISLLKKKADEGVEIRIIYDDMGSVSYLPINYPKKLEALSKNIHCVKFNKVLPIFSLAMNTRDHRKLMVVDGNVAFTGGMNLSDRYINIDSPYGHWKDAGVRLVGDAAYSFTLMFLQMWETIKKENIDVDKYKPINFGKPIMTGSGFVQPYADTPLDDIMLSENVYIEMCNQAEKYIYIYTPYLILSESLFDAIILASKRGVDVRIMTPGIPDKKIVYRVTRANYNRLLKAGVRIFEYTPGFLHSKCMAVDNKIAIVGTINFDYRSLFLNYEDAVLFANCSAVSELSDDFIHTQKKCMEIQLDTIKVGSLGRIINSILKIFSPMI